MFSSLRAPASVTLLAALVPLACGEAPEDPVGAEPAEALDGSAGVLSQQGPPKGILLPSTQEVPVQLAPDDPELGLSDSPDPWGDLLDALKWRLDPSFDGQVRVYAVLVDGGTFTVTKPQFVSDPLSLSHAADDGEPLSDYVDPPSQIPSIDDWIPGDAFVPGGELTAGRRLLPVSTLLGGNEWWPAPQGWIPEPDGWIPGPDNWIPSPDGWVTAGIIDGILVESGASALGQADAPRTLVIGVPVGGDPGRQGAAGGVVVFFQEK